MRDEERRTRQDGPGADPADAATPQRAERVTTDEELPASPSRAAEEAGAGGMRRGGPSSDLYGTRERVLRRERALQQEREMREQWPPDTHGRSTDRPEEAAADDGPAPAGSAQDAPDAREAAPEPAAAGERDAAGRATPGAGRSGAPRASGTPGAGAVPSTGSRLIPQEESDRLAGRLHEALAGFVDEPRSAVEQAAEVLEEAAERLRRVLAERPRALRSAWDGRRDDGDGHGADTEELRLALRTYREVTERLLGV